MAFDKKFTAKYDISKRQLKHVFYKLCQNAKNSEYSPETLSVDAYIIKQKTKALEKNKPSDWISKKVEKASKQTVKEAKSHLSKVKRKHQQLKNKGTNKQKLKQAEKRIKELGEKISKIS